MRRIIGIFVLLLGMVFAGSATSQEDSAEFRAKLGQLLTNVEKSISILRNQIHESQHAAFLPDLYFELADLLSQKSTALYYIQKERAKDAGGDMAMDDSKAGPVIVAQKEANQVLESILEDFPQYAKRAEVMYSLALGYNAIDESPLFFKVVQRLKADYAGSNEAIRAAILLGQHLFQKGMVDEAIEQWSPIARDSKESVERNQARYYMGLALVRKQQDKDALTFLEAVAKSDENLIGQDETRVSLEKRQASSDLRREALLESIIPFTNVLAKTTDPIKYYSNLSPNETIFQEVLEKLAYRYAFLKQYDESIRLLRVLSQRMRDVQRILVIYGDVLRLIPYEARLDISPTEMRYVLERLNYWRSFFTPDANLRSTVSGFFEVQLRELGTRAHAEAKKDKGNEKFNKAAEEYYKLYLAFFSPSATAGKVAANLGDLYLQSKDFLNCGNYYLNAALGNFGPPQNKKELLQNALFCLDQRTEGSFYQQTRKRGLLINAIEFLRDVDAKQALLPATQLSYARAVYENGERDRGIELLRKFVSTFPKSGEAIVAGEILLDHFNKTQDYAGLGKTTQFLSSAGLKDTSFIKRVNEIQRQAAQKLLDEKIRTFTDYDDFAQGRSYLQAAMSSDDSLVRNAAIQEALAKSRSEGDLQTFAKAATLMASNEKDVKKRAEVYRSLGREQEAVGDYARAVESYLNVLELDNIDDLSRQAAMESAVNVALITRDSQVLSKLSRKPQWKNLGGATRKRVTDFVADLLISPAEIDGDLDEVFAEDVSQPSALPAFVQAGEALSSKVRSRLERSLESQCSRGRQQPACRWNAFVELDGPYMALRKELLSGSRNPNGIEKRATQFQAIWGKLRELQGSRDPYLEAAIALRSRWLFLNFAEYLADVGKENPDLREVLSGKVQETRQAADKYGKGCAEIRVKAAPFSPAARQCGASSEPLGTRLYSWESRMNSRNMESFTGESKDIENTRKVLFRKPENKEALLNLADQLYRAGAFHHAAGVATFGVATGKQLEGDFRVLLGCSVGELGLLQEASFHLDRGSDYKGMKAGCKSKIMRGGK